MPGKNEPRGKHGGSPLHPTLRNTIRGYVGKEIKVVVHCGEEKNYLGDADDAGRGGWGSHSSEDLTYQGILKKVTDTEVEINVPGNGVKKLPFFQEYHNSSHYGTYCFSGYRVLEQLICGDDTLQDIHLKDIELWSGLHKACDEIEALTYMKLDVNKAKEKIILLTNSLTLEEFVFLRAQLDRLRQKDYISRITEVVDGQSRKLKFGMADFYDYGLYEDDVNAQSKGIGRNLSKIRLVRKLLRDRYEELLGV